MPLKATFAADFSAFSTAVDKAILSLKDFESNASRIDRSLSRFGEQFSGRKIMQDATLAARAIEEIGGVAKLTEREIAQVTAQFQEATAKMKAMGVEAPASFQKIARELDAIPKKLDEIPPKLSLVDRTAGALKSTFGQLFSAFTAATLVDRAVSSLISFGKAAIDDAGHLVDLADKTGISIEALQEMEYAAEQTGGSIDAMTDAAFKLGVTLSKGGDSVAKAVDELGLSFADLRAQRPEDQFRTVVTALGQMHDATERNRIGTELFGRGFGTIAASVTSDYARMAAAAPKMADAHARALDDMGDALNRLKTRLQKATGDWLAQIFLFYEAWERRHARSQAEIALMGQGKETRLPGALGDIELPAGPEPEPEPGQSAADLTMQARAREAMREKERASSGALARAFQEADDAAARMHRHMLEWTADDVSELRRLEAATNDYTGSLLGVSAAINAMPTPTPAVPFDRPEWDLRTVFGRGQAQDAWLAAMKETSQEIPDLMTPPAQKAGSLFGNVFSKEVGSRLVSTIQSALQGGGAVSKSLGGLIGGLGTHKIGETLGQKIGDGIGGKLGATLGGVVGSVIPVFGTMIGALAGGAIGKGLGKLFGGGGEGKEVNKQRDEWIQSTFGTSDNLRKLAAEAGVSDAAIRQLFSASKVKDFERAVESVTGKMKTFQSEQDALTAEREADAARLQAAIDKYGFTLQQLGPQLQKQKLDEQAKELIEDWRVLVDAGIEIADVNTQMAKSVNEFLQNAIKTGQEIPLAFKPILERMVQQGTLTDAAGTKIENLESIGIQYSQTMTQNFDRIVTKLDELIAKIGGTADELIALPNIDRTITYHIQTEGSPPSGASSTANGGSRPESYGSEQSLPGYQTGTHGRYLDFGAGTPVMLHGKERIVTEDETTVASAQMTTMVNAIASLQTSLVRAIRDNALQVRDQTQLAIGRA